MTEDELEAYAAAAAKRNHIPVDWYLRLIGKGEGGFANPEGVSPKGARGVGQLMPATARAMGVTDPDDPKQSIDGSAKYAGQMWRRYKADPALAAAAYNAGPGAVDRHGGVPPIKETQAYVARVGAPSAADALDTPMPPSAADALGPAPKAPAPGPTPAPTPQATQPAPRPNVAERLAGQFGHVAASTARGEGSALQQLGQDIRRPSASPLDYLANQGRIGLDVLNVAGGGALGGLADAALGEPVANTLKALTGLNVPAGAISDLALLGLPLGGEAVDAARLASRARAAGVSTDALRAADALRAREQAMARPRPATPHQEAAQRLQREGVHLTPGQAEGGRAKTFEDRAETGSPYRGPAIAEARGRAQDSFNRVALNRAYHAVGEHMPTDEGPVGREAIDRLEKRLGGAYERALVGAQAGKDAEWAHDVSVTKTHAKSLDPSRRATLDTGLERVERLFGPDDKMEEHDFKSTESWLRRQARGYRGNRDFEDRQLGDRFDDLANALRRSVERHSPPGTVAALKRVDTGWAVFKRLQRASAQAGRPDGTFTPKELATSIRVLDRSLDKSAFARGDALLQDLARDAQEVMPNKVRDPGTAAQLKTGLAGRALGMAGGAVLGAHVPFGSEIGAMAGYGLGEPIDKATRTVTNALAARMLRNASRTGAPRNFLKSVDQRVLGRPAAIALPVAAVAGRNPNQ